MRRAEGRRVRGFTLLEGVVALTVLGAVSIAALGTIRANLRATTRAGHVLTATALAEERLVTLRLLEPGDLVPLTDSLRSGRFGPPLAAYGWSTEVSRSGEGPALVRVVVRIHWDGGSEMLETLLPAGPP